MRKLAFKVFTAIFFGFHDHDHVDLDMVDNLYTILNLGMKSMAINLPGFAFHRALKVSFYKCLQLIKYTARKKLKRILEGVLERKRNNNKRKDEMMRRDLISVLMEVKDEEGRQLEDEDIVDLLVIFLLAGHESSAHGILWTIIYLTQHPVLFLTAKREQQEIINTRPSMQTGLDIKEIKRMTYLSKVIDEMLRRTTISFANFRQAKVNVNINGYTIPKDWKILVWNRGVHMDPETYPNPMEFDPSRWDNYHARAGSFLPFGLGSRLCPGGDLAKLEITIFLHHFLLNYKMERINPDCPVIYLPVPRPSDNCLAKIVKAT